MRLSIITITYNAEKAVKKTIQSILQQTNPIYEYIFVDGGSKDGTNKVIDSYEKELNNKGIRVIHISEKDNGISDAFNKGIKLATGDLIGIINADDELLPESSAYLSKHFYEHSDSDIIYGNCEWVDEDHKMRLIKKPCHNLGRLYYDLVLLHPATFVTKNAYEKYGQFNLEYKLCMDKELLCRMYVAGAKFSYLDKELSIMRAGGVSDLNAMKTIAEGIRLSNHYKRPKYITYPNALRKVLKHKFSKILKRIPIYFYIKNAQHI